MTRSATMCNHCCYVLTPFVWIAHLLLASTLKAYHDIIPDNLVGVDWGTLLARPGPACKWERMGLKRCLLSLALWRFFQVAPRVLPYKKKTYPNIRRFRYPAMTSNILLTFMAIIGAWLRLCALLRREQQQKHNQAVPKKRPFFAGNRLHKHGPL